jgi:16S rRNA (guanine(966)-N(2))-methyltransferase RsmD
MRIIGGKAKGRRFVIPAGLQIRPTSDRIRESLFNILPDVQDGRFLDLFAGTGSVGMEALSRGAARAVFVEIERLCIEAIKVHLARFGFNDREECISATAERAVQRLGVRGERFEVIFMDPPYEEGFVRRTLDEIVESNILAEDGIVAVQHSVREKAEEETGRMKLMDERVYGDSVLSFWKWR